MPEIRAFTKRGISNTNEKVHQVDAETSRPLGHAANDPLLRELLRLPAALQDRALAFVSGPLPYLARRPDAVTGAPRDYRGTLGVNAV